MAADVFESYKKWANELNSRRGTYGKLDLGTTRLRILPWFLPSGEFWVEQVNHFNMRADKRPIPCLRPNPCACCEKSTQLYQQGQKEEANKIGSRVSALVNAVDLGHPENGVRIYTINMGVFTTILKYCGERGINITDPDNGADIPLQVEKSGTSTKTFVVTAFIQTSPLPKKEWLKEMFDLTKIGRGCTYEQQLAMIRGESVDLRGGKPSPTDPSAEFQTPPVVAPQQAPAIPQESTLFHSTGAIPPNASPTPGQPAKVMRNWKIKGPDGKPTCFTNHADEKQDTPDQTIVCETCTVEQECVHATMARQFPADKRA